MRKEKTNLYLISIVAIVAIVGIALMVMTMNTGSSSLEGQALSLVKDDDVIEWVDLVDPMIIVDDDSSPEDLMLATDIKNFLDGKQYGLGTDPRNELNIDVNLDTEVKLLQIEHSVTIIIRDQNVVIIIPTNPEYKAVALASDVRSYLSTNHGITATIVAYGDATVDMIS